MCNPCLDCAALLRAIGEAFSGEKVDCLKRFRLSKATELILVCTGCDNGTNSAITSKSTRQGRV